MFLAITVGLYDFNRYKQPSILFDDIKKKGLKLGEASDLQSEFKHELFDIKKLIKQK